MFGTARVKQAAALLCVAMLLVASSVQVMHHCTALETAATHEVANTSLTSSPLFCNICMTVQVAAVIAVVLVLATARVRSFAPALPVLFPPDASPAFSLYVRPPPSPSC